MESRVSEIWAIDVIENAFCVFPQPLRYKQYTTQ